VYQRLKQDDDTHRLVVGAEMCMMTMLSLKWCVIRAEVTENVYDDSRYKRSTA
jgi:hypothetical protein